MGLPCKVDGSFVPLLQNFTNACFFYLFVCLFLVALGFKLRDSHLLGRQTSKAYVENLHPIFNKHYFEIKIMAF
jgi:hypothetical protein